MRNIRKRMYLYAITSFVIIACGVVAGCVRLDNHSDALKLEDNIEIVYGDSLYKKEIEGEINTNNDTESLMCLVCDGGIFGENLEVSQEIFVKNPSFKLKAGSESCYFRAKLNYWGLFDGELFSIENKEDYFDVTITINTDGTITSSIPSENASSPLYPVSEDHRAKIMCSNVGWELP